MEDSHSPSGKPKSNDFLGASSHQGDQYAMVNQGWMSSVVVALCTCTWWLRLCVGSACGFFASLADIALHRYHMRAKSGSL